MHQCAGALSGVTPIDFQRRHADGRPRRPEGEDDDDGHDARDGGGPHGGIVNDVDDRHASDDGEVVRRERFRHLRAEGHTNKAGQQSHDHRWKQVGHKQGSAGGSKRAQHGDFTALTADQSLQGNRQNKG